MKTIAMKCASCGAGLQIAPDMDHFACGYCGASLTVARQGGTVALNLVADSIAKVQVGTDRTAAELAIARISKEIDQLRNKLAQNEKDIYLVRPQPSARRVGWWSSKIDRDLASYLASIEQGNDMSRTELTNSAAEMQSRLSDLEQKLKTALKAVE